MARIALVTGVSRRVGIGTAITRRLTEAGYRLLLTGLPSYDDAQPYGGDPSEAAALHDTNHYLPVDLTEPDAPRRVVAAAVDRYGGLDVLVVNHAYSTETALGSLDAAEIDRHLTVNVRATMLLVEAFAEAYRGGHGDGRVVLFSSGQRLGPMPSELAYAASKAAVECLTSPAAAWITGQVIDSEGGFDRFR